MGGLWKPGDTGEEECCFNALFRVLLNRRQKTTYHKFVFQRAGLVGGTILLLRAALEVGPLDNGMGGGLAQVGGGLSSSLQEQPSAFQGPSAPSQRNAGACEPLELSVPYLAMGLLQFCFHSFGVRVDQAKHRLIWETWFSFPLYCFPPLENQHKRKLYI